MELNDIKNVMETMDIYAESGTKVVFAFPDSGYKLDQERAKQFLEVGKEYTVDRVEVGGWSSVVYLKEIEGKPFNTVLFGQPSKPIEGVICDSKKLYIS